MTSKTILLLNYSQRKFLRERPPDDTQTYTYQKFRKWLQEKYSDGMLNEKEWEEVLEEGRQAACPSGYGEQMLEEEGLVGVEDDMYRRQEDDEQPTGNLVDSVNCQSCCIISLSPLFHYHYYSSITIITFSLSYTIIIIDNNNNCCYYCLLLHNYHYSIVCIIPLPHFHNHSIIIMNPLSLLIIIIIFIIIA